MVSNKFYEKLNKVKILFLTSGLQGIKKHLLVYFKSNLKDKWDYIYFEISLEKNPYTLPPLSNSLNIRVAKPVDIPKIESDIYPLLTSSQENDKRYISYIGEKGITCFITEHNFKIVHYFLVFERASESPLIKTPFSKLKILENDAYLGSTFTAPEARGLWIVPHALLYILTFLRNTTNNKRALLLVHKDTPGAVAFFCRLGFKSISDSVSYSFLFYFYKFLNKFIRF